jgi:hypothetical protein
MNWTVVALVAVLPTIVLLAWGMWLGFGILVAKWHGPDGLKAVRHVADGFRPREWALLGPRQVLSSALATLSTLTPGGGHRGVRPSSFNGTRQGDLDQST